MENEIIIANANENTAEKSHELREPYEYLKAEVAKIDGPVGLTAAVYELPPEKSNYQYHFHTVNSEVFYIISGTGVLKTPDGEKAVASGDIIVCPPGRGGAHKLTNASKTEPLKYIDIDTNNSPDVLYYPDSGKTGVVCGASNTFYLTENTVDYYEGE